MLPERAPQLTSSVGIRLLVVAAVLVAGTMYLARTSRAEEVPPRLTLATLPMEIDGRTGRREPDFSSEILKVLGVDDYVIRTYRKPGAAMVGLYAGYYASQRQGDAIHSPLNCLPGAGWQPVEQGRTVIQVRSAEGQSETTPIEVNRVVIQKGLDRQLVLYWYQSHRRVVASEYWGKVYTVLDSVRYHRTDAAMVRVIVPVAEEMPSSSAEKEATSFVQALFPLLGRHLPT